jgi:hypothetical protein
LSTVREGVNHNDKHDCIKLKLAGVEVDKGHHLCHCSFNKSIEEKREEEEEEEEMRRRTGRRRRRRRNRGVMEDTLSLRS